MLLALAASCLLHAAVVFLPYLGAGAGASLPAPHGDAPQGLAATLVLEQPSESAGETAPKPAERERSADAPAGRAPKKDAPGELQRAESIGLLPLPAPTYYTTDRLTKRPMPTAIVELDTPETWPIAVSGRIVMKLWINEFGEVIAADVEQSELPEIFSKTAVAAFKRLRFTPGERNGKPVGTMMRIEVIYDDALRRQR